MTAALWVIAVVLFLIFGMLSVLSKNVVALAVAVSRLTLMLHAESEACRTLWAGEGAMLRRTLETWKPVAIYAAGEVEKRTH